jgi:predicted NUDIX family NTP pyrophosphohydrolase
MPRESAGLLMYRLRNGQPEFLLVHPGGPFWKSKDEGAWSIPKGEVESGEDPLSAAKREFAEELGFSAEGSFEPLQPIRQKSGKVVQAWAFAGECDPATCHSNTFEIEWPPRSGRRQAFPEVDQVAFLSLEEARRKINPAQAALLEELAQRLG